MEEMCKYCSQWNDEKGRCYAPYWCPDRDRMEEHKMKNVLEHLKNELYRENEKKELIDKRVEKLKAMIREIEKESAASATDSPD